MKNILFSIVLLFTITTSFAQVPAEGINYQAIARDTAQMPLANVNLAVRFTIRSDSSGVVTTVFSEIQDPVSTNIYGLFTTVIGKIDTTEFEDIDWTTGEKTLEVEIATAGSTAFVSMGINKLMSVPYALYTKYAANSWQLTGNSQTGGNFIGTTDTNSLIIKTNNAERIKVHSNGNIGIGTPAPNGRLDVKGISNTAFTYGFGVRNSQNLYTIVVRDDNKVGIGNTLPVSLLSVGTTSGFQVNESGTVLAATGITSSGTINFSGLPTNGIVRTTGGTGTLSSSGGHINLATETTGVLPIINGGTGINSLGTWQTFYSNGSGVLVPMPLGTAGTVLQSNGVSAAPSWTTSPTSNTFLNGLHTQNDSVLLGGNLISNTTITGGAYNTLIDLNGTGHFKIDRNGNKPAFYVNPVDGNIGIGTTSPKGKLQVHYDTTINFTTGPGLSGYGSIHIVPDKNVGSNAMGITFGTPDEIVGTLRSTVQAGIYVQGAGAYGTKMYFATTNDFNNGGAKTRMMIDHAGYVGIGTTTPGTSLEISGAITHSPNSVIIGGNGPVLPGNTSYLRMTSPADVTITNLGPGQKIGQILILENANNIAGARIKLTDGNGVNLSSVFFNMDPSHTLTLIWNDSIWLETARSTN